MFITAFGYGINAELSEEDKTKLVVNRGIRLSSNFKAKYIEIIYFSGYYLIESWKKNKKNMYL
jgi:hypothetical protein